jgi:AcrR family transcriptional regulator
MDPSRDEAITAATADCLTEVGYDRLTMEMVASRAKVGKGTLYRRWASKAELVVGALELCRPAMDVPDTGSLHGDLEALIAERPIPDNVEITRLLAGLITAAGRDEALWATVQDRIVGPRKALMRKIIDNATRRGEVDLCPEDVELIINVVPAFLYSRAALSGKPVEAEFFEQVISRLVYPLLAAPASARWDGGRAAPA